MVFVLDSLSRSRSRARRTFNYLIKTYASISTSQRCRDATPEDDRAPMFGSRLRSTSTYREVTNSKSARRMNSRAQLVLQIFSPFPFWLRSKPKCGNAAHYALWLCPFRKCKKYICTSRNWFFSSSLRIRIVLVRCWPEMCARRPEQSQKLKNEHQRGIESRWRVCASVIKWLAVPVTPADDSHRVASPPSSLATRFVVEIKIHFYAAENFVFLPRSFHPPERKFIDLSTKLLSFMTSLSLFFVLRCRRFRIETWTGAAFVI